MAEKNYVGNGWQRNEFYMSLELDPDKIAQLPRNKYNKVKVTVGKLRKMNDASKATHWVAEDDYEKQKQQQNNNVKEDDIDTSPPF